MSPARAHAARVVTLALLFGACTLVGCVPAKPFIDASPDPWDAGAARIDSFATQGDLAKALTWATHRRRAAESGLQPLWRCLEAREVERVLRQRSMASPADQHALQLADRAMVTAARLFDSDSLAAASEAGRFALLTRRAVLGDLALPTGDAALALGETEFRQSHSVTCDSLAVIADAAYVHALGPQHPRLTDVRDLQARVAKNFHALLEREHTLRLYDDVLRERTAWFGPSSEACSAVLQEIGNLDRLMRRPYEAARMFRCALAWRDGKNDPRLRTHASILSSLAILRASQGAWADAEHFAREASAATPPEEIDPLAFRMGIYGQMLRRLGREREAEPVLRRAVALRESLWALSEHDESSVVTSGLALHFDLAVTLAEQGHPEDAFIELQRGMSRTLTAHLLGEAALTHDPWRGLLPRVQQALASDAALVTWVHPLAVNRYEDYPIWACIVRPSGAPKWIALERRAPVTAEGFTSREQFLAELERAAAWPLRVTDTRAMEHLQRQMGAEWFTPLEPALAGVRRLIVCAPDMMAGGPLGALIDAQGRTLLDRFVIAYTPSALLFVNQHEHPRARGARFTRPTLVVGDPAYAPEDPGHWSRLSGTREEAAAVRAAAGGGTLLLDAQASGARLRELARTGALAGFGTIHIASHAAADFLHPMQSALVLAPDIPGTRLDSRLSAREIASQWHLDADLVSLASCRSAVGAPSPTDGWAGLPNAFLIAGARALLVSLWPADDHATTLLMREFYSRLADRAHPCGPATALQKAQQVLRDWRAADGTHPYAHPVYWGTFALMGEAD